MPSWINVAKDFLLKPHVFFLIVAMGLFVTMYVISNRQHDDVIELLDKQRQIQEESNKKIVAAYEEERRWREENLKRLEAALTEVQKKYEEQLKILEQKKERQVEKLVKQYDEDPVEMTKQVGALIGFSVVVQEAK